MHGSVYMCMYVCMNLYMHACLYGYECEHVLVCFCKYLCMTVYASAYIYVDVCICVYMDGFISPKIMHFSFS